MGRGDLHMPPGLGDIDFEGVLGSVLPGFGGMAVCEVRERYQYGLAEHLEVFRELMRRLSTPR
jgi:sugar phosphate isomerase/epimerase